jgi:hypothetical protein
VCLFNLSISTSTENIKASAQIAIFRRANEFNKWIIFCPQNNNMPLRTHADLFLTLGIKLSFDFESGLFSMCQRQNYSLFGENSYNPLENMIFQ